MLKGNMRAKVGRVHACMQHGQCCAWGWRVCAVHYWSFQEELRICEGFVLKSRSYHPAISILSRAPGFFVPADQTIHDVAPFPVHRTLAGSSSLRLLRLA